MKNMNRKGFAITVMLYSILTIIAMTMFLILSIMSGSRKANLDLIDHIKDDLNNNAYHEPENYEETVFYSYTGNYETFEVTIPGRYLIEAWGAQGGSVNTTYIGGRGSYTKGEIILDRGQILYIYVGEYGFSKNETNRVIFNNGTFTEYSNGVYGAGYGLAGGGSTDIRLVPGEWNDFDSLKSRIMVAAGGGGAQSYFASFSGGAGGGLSGYNGSKSGTQGYVTTGGTQTLGGKMGVGDYGANIAYNYFGVSARSAVSVGKGGNGYYAGGSAAHGGATVGSGAGGSSFISGHNGCNAIAENSTSTNLVHTGQANHYSNYIFTNTVMIDGNGYNWTNTKGEYIGMPTFDGTQTVTGNTENGYAKITFLGK